jgi:hypothetical protein
LADAGVVAEEAVLAGFVRDADAELGLEPAARPGDRAVGVAEARERVRRILATGGHDEHANQQTH